MPVTLPYLHTNYSLYPANDMVFQEKAIKFTEI